MKYVYLPFALAVAVLTLTFLTPTKAKADIIYSATPPPGVQQTANNPCIIGDPSCNTNTGQTSPLDYTSNASPCTGGNCDFFSPLYQASSSGLADHNIIPTEFEIGVDDNAAESKVPEVLEAFNVWTCDSGGGGCTLFDSMGTNAPADLNYRSGTGYADGLLSNFKPLISGDYYKFEAIWSNDTAGQEQFWIIPRSVPEPGTFTLTLIGIGLLGLAGIARRRPARP